MTSTTNITLHVDVDRLIAVAIVVFSMWAIMRIWSLMYDSKRPAVKEAAEWILLVYMMGFFGKIWWDCVSQPLPGLVIEKIFVSATFAWSGVCLAFVLMPKNRWDKFRSWVKVRPEGVA